MNLELAKVSFESKFRYQFEMSRIAERDLLGIRVPCTSYHIMRRNGATLLINMHVFCFSEFMNLAFAPPSLLPWVFNHGRKCPFQSARFCCDL